MNTKMILTGFFVASVMSATYVEGSFRIDELRTPRPIDVGSSLVLVDKIFRMGIYTHIFPKSGPAVTLRMDRTDGWRTVAHVFEKMTACDRKLAKNVHGYVKAVLKRYNRIAYEYLRTVTADKYRAKKVVTISSYAYGYPFFTYLNDAGTDVRNLFDNALMYFVANYQADYDTDRMAVRIHAFGIENPYTIFMGMNDTTTNSDIVRSKLLNLFERLRKLSDAFRCGYPQWLFVHDPNLDYYSLSPVLRDCLKKIKEVTCTVAVSVCLTK